MLKYGQLLLILEDGVPVRFFFPALVLLLQISSIVHACPSADKVPDYNCDGIVQITVIGDSLVYGYGDSKNKNRGGYVLRTASKLTDIKFVNLGEKGMRSLRLLEIINDALINDTNSEVKDALVASDIIILDIGRNDRWLFGLPSATYRNLKRASSQLKSGILKYTDTAPIVVTAVMMLPNRGSQGPWVKELNAIILKSDSLRNPADLRFDLVSKRLLGNDQIHPTADGYKALAQTFLKYLTVKLPKRIKQLHPDSDNDGLPDIFESERFGTNPNIADTDGDSIFDGDELFTTNSDPLVANRI